MPDVAPSPAPARPFAGHTPAALGYAFPPEWAPHAGTWLSWPRPEGISFPGRYEQVVPNLAAIVEQIGCREGVFINVPDASWQARAADQLRANHISPEAMSRVRFFRIPTNESWCRDHGPAFVKRVGSGQWAGGSEEASSAPCPLPPAPCPLCIVDWGFNAWGGKYPPYDADDAVPVRVAEALGLPLFQPAAPDGRGVVMEGGAVDFNGAGTVLTTESCLLNPNRNPGLSKPDIERYLKDYYGQSHVCWLGDGIAGDDTDGHVDDLARFVDARTIVTTVEDDPSDANYDTLQDNLARCRSLRDQAGRPFDVVTLPMPGVVEHDGQRLPATYANFYFVNGAVLVPTYRHPNDAVALATLSRLLPGREVVGVDCTELIWGLGAIHCLTQQQPAV